MYQVTELVSGQINKQMQVNYSKLESHSLITPLIEINSDN